MGQTRLLLLSITPFFGGGENYLYKLARLVKSHCALRALVAEPKLAALLGDLGVPCELLHGSGAFRYAAAGKALLRTCRSWKPDVLHLNGQGEAHLALLARLLKQNVLAVRHTQLNVEIASRHKRKLVIREYASARAVVCMSSHVRGELAAAGLPAHKLHTIPNWIEADHMVAAPKPVSDPRRPFRLLVAGRLTPLKGVLDAVLAMRALPGAELHVVGEGPQRAELEAVVHRLHLPVRFHGFQADCTRFYDEADLLVFPSHSEGQGLVPLEAMARGTPCLVSDIPAALETAEGGRCAAVFRRGDPQDLARQVQLLRADPARRESLAAAGLARVRDSYSEDAVRPRYLALYRSLCRSENGHP